MLINNVTVENYKSIKLVNNLALHNKINIFAGKNNTGKTALIEIIYKTLNAEIISVMKQVTDQQTRVILEITVDSDDLHKLHEGVQEDYRIKDIDKFKVEFRYNPLENVVTFDSIKVFFEGKFNPLYTNQSEKDKHIYIFNNVNGGGTTFVGSIPKFIMNLFIFIKENIIFINGSRFVPGIEEAKLNTDLSIDGTNLNAFLYTLRNNEESVFEKIKNTFIKIFDDVKSISTPINDEGQTNISITFEGLDKSISLNNCGSGYTHVLLFLCVLFTRKSRVVLFDEPQVFLHPSAEKAIYDLIAEVGEQQYLLTTHSPILINYPFEKDLIYVKKENSESEFIKLNEIQEVLSEIGVKNSDFALSEKIIFVEGETEEVVLPVILNSFGAKQLGYSYRIIRMNGTGNDFIKHTAMNRNKEKIDQILGQISLSPIPYRILIDMDEKNKEKIKAIEDRYGENIIILDRREFENYFLECYQELASVISEEITHSIEPAEIEHKIESLLALVDDRKLYPKESSDKIVNVVGSEVMERVFKEYSIGYNKIKHGLQLTEKILESNAEPLEYFKEKLIEFVMD